MKKQFGRYLPLLASLLFFLPTFTSWSQTISNLQIGGRAPGGTYRSSVQVTFTAASETDVNYYSVQYSLDDFAHHETIMSTSYPDGKIPVGNGSYSILWNTDNPSSPDSSNYSVRVYITKISGSDIAAAATGPFTIQNTLPDIDITAPEDSPAWSGTKNITWTVTGTWADDQYRIEYSDDGGATWSVITTFAATETDPAYLSYAWDTTTATDQPGADFRIRITGTVSGGTDTSDNFTIDNIPPVITITADDLGKAGTSINNIFWYREVIPITIVFDDDTAIDTAQYSLDGGTTWHNAQLGTGGEYTFDLANSRTLIRARATDAAGNTAIVEGIDMFTSENDRYNGLLYVDTFPPRTSIEIQGAYWPTITTMDPLNPSLPMPEFSAPPTGYTQAWIDYLYIVSNSNTFGLAPTQFRLIVNDTPPASPVSDGRASSGVNRDFNLPWYRISYDKTSDLTDVANLDSWLEWVKLADTSYSDSDSDGYNERAITAWFSLPANTTSIEYFATDNLGNEEDHHQIVEQADRTPEASKPGNAQAEGSGNIRTDDYVPEPVIAIALKDAPGEPAVPNEDGWYAQPVVITIVCEDDIDGSPWKLGDLPGSGINRLEYALGTNTGNLSGPHAVKKPDSMYTNPVSVTNGIVSFTYRAIDNLGNTNGNQDTPYLIYDNNPIKVDTVSPVTTVTIDGLNLILTATDNLSGVKTIRYKIDAVPANDTDGTSYDSAVPMASIVTVIYYWAEDNAGNFEEYGAFYPGIADGTPPITEISVSSGAFYQDPYTGVRYIASSGNANSQLVTRFRLYSNDTVTGIMTGYPVYSFVNAEPWNVYAAPFPVPAESSHIYYYARDGRGNTEAVKDYIFTVDDTAPVVAIALTCDSEASRHNGWYNILSGTPTVTLTATDAGSGVNYFRYDIAGGVPATTYIGQFSLSDGAYNIVYRAVDNIGNQTPDTSYGSNPVQVDMVAPVSTLTPSAGTFYLAATDNYSGIDTLNYLFILADDSTTSTTSVSGASASFMPYPGAKRLEYWAVDVAGNEEIHNTLELGTLDDTPPQSSIRVVSGRSYVDMGTLWINSADNPLGATQLQVSSTDPADSESGFSSGIASGYPRYMFDNGDWIINPAPYPYSEIFTVRRTEDLSPIHMYAMDGAGNEESPAKQQSFKIDDGAPSGSTFAIAPAAPDGHNGWYITQPTITISGTTDTDGYGGNGSGMKEVRYTIRYATDLTDPSIATGTVYSGPFRVNKNTKVDNIRYAGFDNLGNMEDPRSSVADDGIEHIWVDTERPEIDISINYTARQFSVEATDNLSGFDWATTNSDLYPVQYIFLLDGAVDPPPPFIQYARGSSVDIPENAVGLLVKAMDIAGNSAEQTVSFSAGRKVTGQIRTYQGIPVSGVRILLLGGDSYVDNTVSAADGKYEFTGLRALGSYCIVPVLANNLPVSRVYEVFGNTNKTGQDFVVYPGWTSTRYDRGGSRDYRFGSTLTALSPLKIVESASLPANGTHLLSGFLDVRDPRINALVGTSDGGYLSGYVYNAGTSTYVNSLAINTIDFKPFLAGSVREDTTIDIVLCGRGGNIAQILDKTGEKIRDVTTGILDVSRQTPPSSTEWSTNFTLGKGGVLFTGTGSGYNVAFRYNALTDSSEWETTLSQTILHNTSVMCVHSDGKIMMLSGGQSDTRDITLTALDVITGQTLWTTVFASTRGNITPLVYVNESGWDNLLAICTSSNGYTGQTMKVCRLNPATGAILHQWTGFNAITPLANTSFRAAVADLDNDGVKELVLSDGSGNMHILNLASGNLVSAADRGKLWAVVDFDGQAGKEIIVSAANEIRVLSSTLDIITSRVIGVDDIESVAVSDMRNSGRVDILVSIPGSTRILRAALNTEVPGAPASVDAYSINGRAIITWCYVPTSADLSGFRIWRSADSGITWTLVGTVTSERTSYVDNPSGGIYAYKVSAYNDFGETYSNNNAVVEVIESSGDSGESGMESCFIATAAFGTPMAKEVVALRNFRDKYLLASRAGRAFVRWYYRHSPAVAEYIRDRKVARALVRASLRPLLWILSVR